MNGKGFDTDGQDRTGQEQRLVVHQGRPRPPSVFIATLTTLQIAPTAARGGRRGSAAGVRWEGAPWLNGPREDEPAGWAVEEQDEGRGAGAVFLMSVVRRESHAVRGGAVGGWSEWDAHGGTAHQAALSSLANQHERQSSVREQEEGSGHRQQRAHVEQTGSKRRAGGCWGRRGWTAVVRAGAATVLQPGQGQGPAQASRRVVREARRPSRPRQTALTRQNSARSRNLLQHPGQPPPPVV